MYNQVTRCFQTTGSDHSACTILSGVHKPVSKKHFFTCVLMNLAQTNYFINFQEKKKKNKRYKDKQGFVWRRMVPDDEFPVSRTPQPHLPDSTRTILPPPPPQTARNKSQVQYF